MRVVSTTIPRRVSITNYIPLQIRSDRPCMAAEYLTIRQEDHSLLELTYDQMDSLVHRITLMICSDYKRFDEDYVIPGDCIIGDISVDGTKVIESQLFSCLLYNNAIKILISNEPCSTRVLSGDVVWELSAQGELVSVIVADKTGEAVNHCLHELSVDN